MTGVTTAAAARGPGWRAAAALALALAAPACADPASASPGAPGAAPPAGSAPAAAPALSAPPDAPAPAPATKDEPVHLALVGDISLGLHVGHYLGRRARGEHVPAGVDEGYPFTAVRERLAAADLAVGNLECVLSDKGSPSSAYTVILGPPVAAESLRVAGLDFVSVANNHTADMGKDAFHDMREMLVRVGVTPLGSSLYPQVPQEAVIREVRGLRIGLLAYPDMPRVEMALDDVRRARPACDVLVVFNHWGVEDIAGVSVRQRTIGHGLVDAGADIVVGAHSHVMQPEERYKGGYIHYGLGNFVFSGMGHREARLVGAYLEVDVDRSGVVARRVSRIHLDELGAPRWMDQGRTFEPASAEEPPPAASPRSPR